MRITHSIQFSTEEIDNLFEIAQKAGAQCVSPAYSEEEIKTLLLESSQIFAKLLTCYGSEAFEFGYHAGIAHAGAKDTAMYAPV